MTDLIVLFQESVHFLSEKRVIVMVANIDGVLIILVEEDNNLKLMAEVREFKPVIKGKEISAELEGEIIATARYALDKMHTLQEMATHLKDELNRKYNGDWHAFVGRNFGSYVTYEANHYMYFYIGQYGFLVFKTVKNA